MFKRLENKRKEVFGCVRLVVQGFCVLMLVFVLYSPVFRVPGFDLLLGADYRDPGLCL